MLLLAAGGAQADTPLNQLLFWPDGTQFETVPLGSAIVIDTGRMGFVTSCEKGTNDFLFPFTDVYIVPSGSVHLGDKLTDVGGSPNPISGATDGSFVDELIGTTVSSAKDTTPHRIPIGTYAVVYDECQDGTFDENDAIFDPAFTVSADANVPPLDLTGFKEHAGESTDALESLLKTVKSVKFIADHKAEFECAQHALESVSAGEVTDELGDCIQDIAFDKVEEKIIDFIKEKSGLVDPFEGAENYVENAIKHAAAIKNDPPDSNYKEPSLLPPAPPFDAPTQDPLLRRLVAAENAIGNEDALFSAMLHSLERYQGAEQDHAGDAALLHARELVNDATVLTQQLPGTSDLLNQLAAAAAADPVLPGSGKDWNAMRDQLVAQGFGADHIRQLENDGLTDADIQSVEAEIIGQQVTGTEAADLQAEVAALQTANTDMAQSAQALAAQMSGIASQLEADPAVADSAPVANAGGPYSGTEGSPLTLDGSASVANAGHALTDYSWDLNDDGTFGDASGASPSVTFDHPYTGTVALRVTDDAGQTSVAYAQISVGAAGDPPSFTSFAPVATQQSVTVGGALAFSVNGADATSVTWSVDAFPQATGTAAFVYTPGAGDVGPHLVTATAKTPDGSTAQSWHVAVLAPDADGDGWNANVDCNDADPAVNPGATEIPGNGKDDDCNPGTSDIVGAPTAAFSVTNAFVGVAAQFTDQSSDNGTIVSRSWDFGDGATSTDANPTHTYAAAGTYTVSLTVTDNDNLSTTLTKSLAVALAPPGTAPVASFDPQSGSGTNIALKEAGATVTGFSSAFDSNHVPDAMIDAVDDFFPWATVGLTGQFATIQLAGGPKVIDRVQLRGRSSCCTQQRPQQFAVDVSTDGTTFTQVLQATAANVGDLQTFTLPQPVLASYVRYRPLSNYGDCCNISTAQFTALTGQIGGATVTFHNTSTDAENDIVASTWNFGDGSPASHEPSPTHTYASPGTYHVTLTELDATGRSSTTTLDQTVVAPPRAVIYGDDTGTTSAPVGFDATSSVPGDAPILLYLWTWGDGTVSSGANVTHQYASDGDYTVRLDIVDGHGVTDEATHTVSIHAHAGTGSAAAQWVTGFPYNAFGGCCGPEGMAWSPSGDLYVVDNADGFLYRFAAAGGIADAAHRVGSTSFGGNDTGLAFDGQGRLWVGRINMGDVAQLNPDDGTVIRTVSAPCPISLAVDPVSGDLFEAACTGGIYRIADQGGATPQVSLYASPGVTQIAFDDDGTLYALSGGAALQIDGTSAASPGHVSLLVAGGLPAADGLAVSSSGFAGLPPQLFLNRRDGIVTHVDPIGYPAAFDDLYLGGTRGSQLSIGPDGCLYAAQLTSIVRLTNANGDCALRPGAAAPQLTVAPPVVTPQHTVGGTASVRATLLGSAARPGVEVSFTVTGANPQTAVGTTDVSGTASFSYTASAAGDDTIVATATVDGTALASNAATVHWDVAASAPPVAFFDPQGRGRDVALLEGGATVADVSSFFPGWSPDVMLNYTPDDFPDAWATGDGQLTGQWVKVALPGTYQLDGFRVMPRIDGAGQRVHVFEVDVSTTGTADSDFTTVVHATARDEGSLQVFTLDRPVQAHYVRYRPLSRWGTGCCISTSQFKAMTGQFGDATVQFQNLSTGAQSYAWDFGDGGQATTENPTHTFPGPGTYHVTLTATNAAGTASYSLDYTVERAPSSEFSFSPALPNEGQTVSFTSTPTGADGAAIVRATWDFGDGSAAVVGPLTPTHVYGDNGTYTVTETVVDSNDDKTTVQHVVTVANVTPAASPPASVPTFEDRPLSLNFGVSDPGSNEQLHCHWDFGDGSTGDQLCGSFSHIYTSLGTDHATVTVTDKDGASSSASMDVVVQRRAQIGYAATDFVRGFPQQGFDISPVGLAFDSGDNLYADDYATGFLYKFGPHGGTVGDATRLGSAPLGCHAAGLAFSKSGRLYLARQCNNDVVEVDPATGQVLREVVGGIPCPTGLATDPLSGDLFVTTVGCSGVSVYRLQHVEDGATPTATPYGSYGTTDGITFAPDGTMYLESNDQPTVVAGTDAASPGAVLHTYPFLNQMDGIAVAQSGDASSPPFIFANRNDGTITKVDLTTSTPTLSDIFVGGTRGDFVAVGPDGCLYATQSATIVRVTNADGTCTLAGTSVVPQLGLSPAHADLFHGSTASIKATITNVAAPGGTVVSFTVTGANPQTGTAVAGDDGTATFTYTGSNVGDDSVTATAAAAGAQLASNTATVTWQNRAPTASDASLMVVSGSASPVTLAASDPDGDALTYAVVSQPAHGTLDGTAPNLTYTAAAGYTGPDSFTFRVNDGRADSNLATISLDVVAPNLCTVPAANPGGIFLTGHDPDFHSQNNENESGAEHILQRAVAFVSNGKPSPRILLVTGTTNPGGGFLDSRVGVARAGFSFDVAHAGPADAQTLDLSTVDFSQYDVIIVASDFGGWLSQAELDVLNARSFDIMRFVDGGGGLVALAESRLQNRFGFLPFVVTTRPTNVTEVGNTVTDVGAALGITNDDINGNASHNVFTGDSGMFVVDRQPDGELLSLTERGARVGATGLCEPPPPVSTNHAPVAEDQSVSTDEGAPVGITAAATDADGDSLTYAVVDRPAHGTLTGTAPSLTYTPDAGFSGDDAFTFTASDGIATSNVATVTIHVRATNHPPLCADASATTPEDTSLDGSVACSDADGQTLTYTRVADAAHGSVTVASDGSFHYVPAANFHGTDSFTFAANDGALDSNTATVTVDVTEVNDPPTAADDHATTPEDTPVTIDVLANDTAGPVDEAGQTLTIDAVDVPNHGTASVEAGKIAYRPAANYNGPDSFGYRVCDNGTTAGAPDPKCARAAVTVDVTPVNDPPTAPDLAVATDEDTPVPITFAPSDPDGDALTITTTSPSHGTFANGTYTPNADYNGPDSFTYTASDGHGGTATGTVSITIRPVNDPPKVADRTVSTFKDTPVGIALTATDVDGDAVTFTTSSPSHGTFDGTTYTPAAGYVGPDSFTYTANDGHGGTATATVSITVVEKPAQSADCTTAVRRIGVAALTRSTVDNDVAGLAEAFRAVAGSSGTTNVVCLFVAGSNAATQVVAGIYADAGGHPGALLARGMMTSAPVSGAFNAVPVAPVPLTAGTPYWIAVLSPRGSGTLRFRDHCCGLQAPSDPQSGPSENSASTTLVDLPAQWVSGLIWPNDGLLLGWAGGPAG